MELVAKKGVIAYHTIKNQFHIFGMFLYTNFHIVWTYIYTESKKQKIIKKHFFPHMLKILKLELDGNVSHY